VPSAVKTAALHLGLAVHDPRTLRDATVVDGLREVGPDVIVVAAYGLILSPDVLAVPRLGCVNIHGSVLPRWRGAAPIQRSILAGDAETGITIMQMEEGLDTGPYCLIDRTPIAEKNAEQLTDELAVMGASMIVDALALLRGGECHWTTQDDELAIYAEKITKRDVLLGPHLSAVDAVRRVRASGSQAPARAFVAGKGLAVTDAAVSLTRVERGSITSGPEDLLLGMSDGTIAVRRVKPDGRNDMPASDWARGLRLTGVETWEGPQ
jgi:methionyl-tRNA formyltransferase